MTMEDINELIGLLKSDKQLQAELRDALNVFEDRDTATTNEVNDLRNELESRISELEKTM